MMRALELLDWTLVETTVYMVSNLLPAPKKKFSTVYLGITFILVLFTYSSLESSSSWSLK